MGDREDRKQTLTPPGAVREEGAEAEGVPAEEGIADDAADRVDLDPEEQPSRPEQGMPPEERRQYTDPDLEPRVAEADAGPRRDT